MNSVFEVLPGRARCLLTMATGYVERFIFETAKISQLFCHQIIWNMKANCYKDDAAEVVSISLLIGRICRTDFPISFRKTL